MYFSIIFDISSVGTHHICAIIKTPWMKALARVNPWIFSGVRVLGYICVSEWWKHAGGETPQSVACSGYSHLKSILSCWKNVDSDKIPQTLKWFRYLKSLSPGTSVGAIWGSSLVLGIVHILSQIIFGSGFNASTLFFCWPLNVRGAKND